jgi:hemoglobin
MSDDFIHTLSRGPQDEAGAKEGIVKRVVHQFYGKVRRDALLGPVFDRFIRPDEWESHLARMCDFWSAILFQTGRYKGNPMLAHLRIDEIGPRHFDRWIELFVETVGEECVTPLAEKFVERALRMRENLQHAIAHAKG